MAMTTVNFQGLPTEMWVTVLSHLNDMKTLGRVCAVSKYFTQLANIEQLWKPFVDSNTCWSKKGSKANLAQTAEWYPLTGDQFLKRIQDFADKAQLENKITFECIFPYKVMLLEKVTLMIELPDEQTRPENGMITPYFTCPHMKLSEITFSIAAPNNGGMGALARREWKTSFNRTLFLEKTEKHSLTEHSFYCGVLHEDSLLYRAKMTFSYPAEKGWYTEEKILIAERNELQKRVENILFQTLDRITKPIAEAKAIAFKQTVCTTVACFVVVCSLASVFFSYSKI
jgi:hypothetical protein